MTSLSAAPFFLNEQTFSGTSDRFAQNLHALRVLAALDRDQRPATDAEKHALAHWTSFGESALIARLVNQPEMVGDLLTADAINGLRRAALTAFYTPLPVVRVVWEAIAQLGFRTLPTFRMIEPAAGIGNVISAMPPDLRAKAQITAVELEPISARILGHIHPDITLHSGVGFQTVDLAANAFDLAISNVPFGNFGVADASMPARFLTARIHDYFFAKAMGLIRPGGVIAFLSSYGTLDKQDARMRTWLAERAELLAAYRLPSGIFAQNAGSQAGTDLLILRKYHVGEAPHPADWLDLADVTLPAWQGSLHTTTGSRYGTADDALRISRYFATNPAQIIGTAYESRHHDLLFYVVTPPPGDLAAALQQRMTATLPHASITPFANALGPDAAPDTPALVDLAAPDLDGVPPAQRLRSAALAEVYTAAKALIHQEIQAETDDALLVEARQQLHVVYDKFVATYGIIAHPANRRVFKHLPELAFLQALEERPQRQGDQWVAEKAPIFTQRTLRPQRQLVDGHYTVQDALIQSLDRLGRVDLPLICRLSGHAQTMVLQDLDGVIFRLPDFGTEAYVTADAYLSGNVRVKLRQARAAAALNPAFERNVAALEQVQPTLLGKDDIIVRLGAIWVPPAVVEQFLTHLIPAFATGSQVRFAAHDASWRINAADGAKSAVENTSRWGTARMTALEILQALLNSSPIVVRDTIDLPDGGTTTVVNDKATAAAQEKAEAIRQAFRDWIWADDARTHDLITIYNERFNALRARDYNGNHLSLPGLNTAVLRGGDLSAWQKAAVWQGLQNQTTLLAHCVGAGKTFTMVTIAREARRMGMANKPCLLVPNHLVGQTAQEALRLFPSLKVLALGPEDFAHPHRSVVMSRIATGDWDLVIVPYTAFQLLPIEDETLTAFYELERNRLRDAMEAAQDAATQDGTDTKTTKRAIKKIEQALERLDVRIQGAQQRMRRDSARSVAWHELGIDLLLVDEAHHYKNLYVPTRLQVAGAPQADSLRALDLRIKTWDLLRRGKKVVFATATPIMNSLGEAFVMQCYLQEQELIAQGIDTFDAWVSVFAEVRDMFEMKPDSSGFQIKSRLNTFINLPELAQLWRTTMNVRTAEQLALPRPVLVTGQPIVVSVPASHALTRLQQSFAARVERIKAGAVAPTVDNMLKVTAEGRLAALDPRLILGGPETPQCKINALVERVTHLYHTYDAAKGTQLIFCDLATPNGKRAEPDGSANQEDAEPAQETATEHEQALTNRVYHTIREKLAQRGIPPEHIAFIHEYATKAKRDELFAAMNVGAMRVLIGSTSKMGTGMNVQRRLIAMHHLDAPWRPGDVEQRDGRILRQGNMWPDVYIFHYVTEGSFDGYIWQLLENKARFIGQVITGEVTARSADDVGEAVLTAAEVKAIASGNPRILARFQLETELGKLDRVRASWNDTRRNLERKRGDTAYTMAQRTARMADLQAMHRQSQAEEAFAVSLEAQIGGTAPVRYTKRADAGTALLTLMTQYKTAALFQRQPITRSIGSYRGATLRVHAPASELANVELHLVYTHDGRELEALERVFEPRFKPEYVFQSIDAGLREIPHRITQHEQRIQEDAATIAACEAELARTVVWEHAARWAQVRADVQAINAELTAARPTNADADASATTEQPTPESTERVSAAAIAAALTALPDADPAWRPAAPITLPPAVRSLELLHRLTHDAAGAETLRDASDHDNESHADVAASTADRVSQQQHPTPVEPTRKPQVPVFGQPLPRRTAKTPLGAAWDELPLFACQNDAVQTSMFSTATD